MEGTLTRESRICSQKSTESSLATTIYCRDRNPLQYLVASRNNGFLFRTLTVCQHCAVSNNLCRPVFCKQPWTDSPTTIRPSFSISWPQFGPELRDCNPHQSQVFQKINRIHTAIAYTKRWPQLLFTFRTHMVHVAGGKQRIAHRKSLNLTRCILLYLCSNLNTVFSSAVRSRVLYRAPMRNH